MISNNVHQQLSALNNFPISISQNIKQQMLPLQNLGENIRQNVHNQLLPVYAMTVKNDMKNGVGGITVVTYGSGKLTLLLSKKKNLILKK